jgi:hypothetical protein
VYYFSEDECHAQTIFDRISLFQLRKINRIIAYALGGFVYSWSQDYQTKVAYKMRQRTCSDILAKVACDKFLPVMIDEAVQAFHANIIFIGRGRSPNYS